MFQNKQYYFQLQKELQIKIPLEIKTVSNVNNFAVVVYL